MSDARHGRFEIDLDEIERQLRRAAEPAPPPRPPQADSPPKLDPSPKSDPLAELARIVGQDDPYRGLFRDNPSGQAPASDPPVMAPPSLRPTVDPRDERSAPPSTAFAPEMDAVLHGAANDTRAGETTDDLFDPVADAYGSLDGALDQDRYEPLAPPRSRKGLVVAGTLVVATVLGTAGWLAWRDSGVSLRSGPPPVIRADNAPLKVAPENPGGMEIPDQNKQIYERGTPDGQTRVVDRAEQPIDVREAARALPQASGAAAPGSGQNGRPTRPNAVATALGEPRRVRTVSVRPDGTLTNTPPSAALDPMPPMIPSSSLPPPVPVATIPITNSGTAARTPAAPAPTTSPSATPAATPPPGPAPVSVLPPRRPRLDTRSELSPLDREVAPPQAGPSAGQRMASASPAEYDSAAATGRFSVQLGIRGSEQEARTAFAQFASKYPELGGRSPAIARAEVGGKTVYRVRVGPLTRDDANTLCTSLKSSGGQCFVTQN
jgi:hypothetical protein